MLRNWQSRRPKRPDTFKNWFESVKIAQANAIIYQSMTKYIILQ